MSALEELALNGGKPVRDTILPYGRQSIDESDIAAVTEVLRSDWLTTGPNIAAFERSFAEMCGVSEAVAVSSGTAALHAAVHALGIGPGDEVIVPTMTFAATANAVVYCGGKPVFADVDPDTLLIDPRSIVSRITNKTRAIIAVDYAGQPCDYDVINALAQVHGLNVIDDACHAVGGSLHGVPVGSLCDLSTFSLHPVKNMTTGEGGVITTNNADWARSMRVFRNHGITTDHRQREQQGSWFYEMAELGYNYRLTDFQCALGSSQLTRLSGWRDTREEIAVRYDAAFSSLDAVAPLSVRSDLTHGYHLYVVKLDLDILHADRSTIFKALRAEGIGVNVHYVPVHLHPFYQAEFGYAKGLCPVAETAYESILSLPIFPAMTNEDVVDVLTAIEKVTIAFGK